ncbi:MAG: M55 family metallopeptidase [candidate division WOR-3 bacterium]
MRVFISIDIEGIEGIVSLDHTRREGKDYEKARKWMTNHLLSVINSLKKNGVEEIIVNDSHGDMSNILFDEIPENVRLITGNLKKLSMVEGVEGCDAGIFLGYHSRAGSRGVLDHTYFGRVIYEVRINDKPVGEFTINAYVAGNFDVPIIFLTGDDEVIKEARAIIPEIEYVITKEARGRFSAMHFSFSKIEKEINLNIKKAIDKYKNKVIKPLKIIGKVKIEADFLNTGMADIAEIMPKTKRVSPRTLSYEAENIIEAFYALRTWIGLASNLV